MDLSSMRRKRARGSSSLAYHRANGSPVILQDVALKSWLPPRRGKGESREKHYKGRAAAPRRCQNKKPKSISFAGSTKYTLAWGNALLSSAAPRSLTEVRSRRTQRSSLNVRRCRNPLSVTFVPARSRVWSRANGFKCTNSPSVTFVPERPTFQTEQKQSCRPVWSTRPVRRGCRTQQSHPIA